jgi:hypothetical protein
VPAELECELLHQGFRLHSLLRSRKLLELIAYIEKAIKSECGKKNE